VLDVVIGRDGVHLIVTSSQHPEAPAASTIEGMAQATGGLASVAGAVPELSTPDGVDALVASYELGFLRGDVPTIGLEEELILVDPATFEPVDAIESVLATLPDERFQAEFRASQIEIVTPVSLTVADLWAELAGARRRLVEALDGRVRLLAAGTHPTSTRPISVADRPRYREIVAEYPWIARRGIPSGLHVHVGVGGPEEALAVYNAVRGYLPEVAALAANSPFFEGADTGLASSRLKLADDQPRSGIPPAFDSWRALATFIEWGSKGERFRDATYLWWDLRPRPEFGTLEFRVADTQTSVEQTAAIAAVWQSLVSALRSRFRAGEVLPAHPTHVINENRWHALRRGLDCTIVDLDTGELVPARTRVGRLLLELEPYADDLGCDDELALAWRLLYEDGARRQREIVSAHGFDGLLRRLVEQTEQG
jgi:carboxylate-amine ligase